MDIRGRSAVVTGGGVRVGRAICLALAGRGANVVVNYHTSAAAAEDVCREIRLLGVDALAVQANVGRAEDVASLGNAARKAFGSPSILVNNAATFPRTPLSTLTERDWDECLSTNLKGPFLCCLEFGREMVGTGGGAIVNIADWAVSRPYLDYLPYLTAKGGVVTMTKAFARELAPTVRVNAVAPGPVAPPADLAPGDIEDSRSGTLLGRWGSPADIASALLFLIEGSDFITGTILPVDGGRLVA